MFRNLFARSSIRYVEFHLVFTSKIKFNGSLWWISHCRENRVRRCGEDRIFTINFLNFGIISINPSEVSSKIVCSSWASPAFMNFNISCEVKFITCAKQRTWFFWWWKYIFLSVQPISTSLRNVMLFAALSAVIARI